MGQNTKLARPMTFSSGNVSGNAARDVAPHAAVGAVHRVVAENQVMIAADPVLGPGIREKRMT
jgi:hypothetical protein